MRFVWLLATVLTGAVACQGSVTRPTSSSTDLPVAESPATVPVAALVAIQKSSTVEQVGTGQTGTSNNYLGQSITIPGTSSFNNLRFSWEGSMSMELTAPSAPGPIAAGDLLILTQEYLGLPASLAASTPGFLARAERIEAGQYVFAPSVMLKGGTKYWFYSSWTPGSIRVFNPITGFSEDGYAGGDMYIAPDLGTSFDARPFRKASASLRVISFGPPVVYYTPPPGTYVDANFELKGAPVAQ